MQRTVRCQGAIIRDGELLLIKHRNHQTGAYYWWLPGGGLETGETLEECVIREVREETNLEVRIERLLLDTPDPSRTYTYERYVTYLCTPVGGQTAVGSESSTSQTHSIIALGWYPLWDENRWEVGFREAHMAALLEAIKEQLAPGLNRRT